MNQLYLFEPCRPGRHFIVEARNDKEVKAKFRVFLAQHPGNGDVEDYKAPLTLGRVGIGVYVLT